MEAFNDRVARAFGALGGAMKLSGHQAPQLPRTPAQSDPTLIKDGVSVGSEKSAAESCPIKVTESRIVRQPIADWPLASSQGFGLLSKKRAAAPALFSGNVAEGGALWTVAQQVESKKRIWEEVESSDDEGFEKKRRAWGVEGSGKGLEEEGDDDAEGQTVTYVALAEEAENADEEAEWVKQMIGLDETLDNEEEEDGYDRMAAPTGTDPQGRIHTSAIGDAGETFAKHVSFSWGRKDRRANRDAAAARLLEDDRELERAKREEALAVPDRRPQSEGALEDNRSEKRVGEAGGGGRDGVLGTEQGTVGREGALMNVIIAMPFECEDRDLETASAERRRVAGSAQKDGEERAPAEKRTAKEAEVPEAIIMTSPYDTEGWPSRKEQSERNEKEERNGLVGAHLVEALPDEQPLSFPDYRSGFMARSNGAVKAPAVLKRTSEQAGEEGGENRVKKKVRFTEEVTERDEQKSRDREAAVDVLEVGSFEKIFRGAQGGDAGGGSLENSEDVRGAMRKGGGSNGQRYVPPHRRAGFVRKPSKVPDYVRNPDQYTRYALEWSDEDDEQGAGAKVSDETQNEGAFLEAVGRLKVELGNIRFEEMLEEQARGQANGNGSVFDGPERAADMEGVNSEMPIKFVKRKKDAIGNGVHRANGDDESRDPKSAPSSSRSVPVAVSAEGLTQAAFVDEVDKDTVELEWKPESTGQPAGFKRKANGQRAGKKYRVRSADEDG